MKWLVEKLGGVIPVALLSALIGLLVGLGALRLDVAVQVLKLLGL